MRVERLRRRLPVLLHVLQQQRHLGQAGRGGRHGAGRLARLAAHELRRPWPPHRRRCPTTATTTGCASTGTMVCAELSANEPGTICSSGPEDSSRNPGLQVPRMPSVSQLVVCVSVQSSRLHQHQHLVAGGGIGVAAAGHQDRIGVRAVGTGGRVLVEPKPPALALARRRCSTACRRRCRPRRSSTPAGAGAPPCRAGSRERTRCPGRGARGRRAGCSAWPAPWRWSRRPAPACAHSWPSSSMPQPGPPSSRGTARRARPLRAGPRRSPSESAPCASTSAACTAATSAAMRRVAVEQLRRSLSQPHRLQNPCSPRSLVTRNHKQGRKLCRRHRE